MVTAIDADGDTPAQARNPHDGAARLRVFREPPLVLAEEAGVPAEVGTSPASVNLGGERLRRLLEVGRSLVAELDLESVLGRVLGTARELTGARYAALGILDERKEELERFL